MGRIGLPELVIIGWNVEPSETVDWKDPLTTTLPSRSMAAIERTASSGKYTASIARSGSDSRSFARRSTVVRWACNSRNSLAGITASR